MGPDRIHMTPLTTLDPILRVYTFLFFALFVRLALIRSSKMKGIIDGGFMSRWYYTRVYTYPTRAKE